MTDGRAPSTQEAVIAGRKPENCTDRELEPLGTENATATPATDQSEGAIITNTHKHKIITDASGGRVLQDKPITDESLRNSLGVGVITDRVQNRASVITVRHLIDRFAQDEKRETGETDSKATDKDEVTAECTTTLQLSTEVSTDESQAPESARHPGKVIVTKVTINSLTVTIKEAMAAEGFFSSDGLHV